MQFEAEAGYKVSLLFQFTQDVKASADRIGIGARELHQKEGIVQAEGTMSKSWCIHSVQSCGARRVQRADVLGPSY